jgi:hypothetical protein
VDPVSLDDPELAVFMQKGGEPRVEVDIPFIRPVK